MLGCTLPVQYDFFSVACSTTAFLEKIKLHAEPAGLPSLVLFPQVPASSWTRWATKFQVHSFAQHAQVVCHADHSEVQVFLFPLEFKPVAMTFVSPHELRFEGGC